MIPISWTTCLTRPESEPPHAYPESDGHLSFHIRYSIRPFQITHWIRLRRRLNSRDVRGGFVLLRKVNWSGSTVLKEVLLDSPILCVCLRSYGARDDPFGVVFGPG